MPDVKITLPKVGCGDDSFIFLLSVELLVR